MNLPNSSIKLWPLAMKELDFRDSVQKGTDLLTTSVIEEVFIDFYKPCLLRIMDTNFPHLC